MKPHLTSSAVSSNTTNEHAAAQAAASHTRAACGRATSSRPERGKPPGSARPQVGKPSLSLARAKTWTHTLVLTGELNLRSARALEAEIERLCEEGVTGITLDLRQLTRIDSIGVAVIAFRCGHCRRHGYEFSLIPGSLLVQRAFAQAGVADSLPFLRDGEPAAPDRTIVIAQPQDAQAAVAGS